MPNDDIVNALLDKGASASEVSDKIKDLLFAKSAEKVDTVKPEVANSMFGDKVDAEQESETEVSNEVGQEEELENED